MYLLISSLALFIARPERSDVWDEERRSVVFENSRRPPLLSLFSPSRFIPASPLFTISTRRQKFLNYRRGRKVAHSSPSRVASSACASARHVDALFFNPPPSRGRRPLINAPMKRKGGEDNGGERESPRLIRPARPHRVSRFTCDAKNVLSLSLSLVVAERGGSERRTHERLPRDA